MALPVGAKLSSLHNFMSGGNHLDFLVKDVTRELALRVQVQVHGDAALKAIFLKHAECARDPDDIEDDSCTGTCEPHQSGVEFHL